MALTAQCKHVEFFEFYVSTHNESLESGKRLSLAYLRRLIAMSKENRSVLAWLWPTFAGVLLVTEATTVLSCLVHGVGVVGRVLSLLLGIVAAFFFSMLFASLTAVVDVGLRVTKMRKVPVRARAFWTGALGSFVGGLFMRAAFVAFIGHTWESAFDLGVDCDRTLLARWGTGLIVSLLVAKVSGIALVRFVFGERRV